MMNRKNSRTGVRAHARWRAARGAGSHIEGSARGPARLAFGGPGRDPARDRRPESANLDGTLDGFVQLPSGGGAKSSKTHDGTSGAFGLCAMSRSQLHLSDSRPCSPSLASRSRRTLLFSLCASVLGCAPSPEPVPQESDASILVDAGAWPAALIELREACNRAGGTFVDGECVCPSEDVGGVAVRQTFDARFATCALPPSAGDGECTSRGGFEQVLDHEGIKAFRTCLKGGVMPYTFRVLQIEFPEGWGVEDARPLAKWIDARFKPGVMTLNAKLSTPINNDWLQVFLGSRSIDESMLRISVRPPSIDPGDPWSDSPRVLQVPSVEALSWALGDSTAARPARNTVPPAEAGNVGIAIESAIAETHLDLGGETTIAPMIQNCLGFCDVGQDYVLGEDGPVLVARRTRRYQTGVLYRETLAVGSPDRRRVDGWVLFDLGGEPSLILRVERASMLKPTVFAYDRNWSSLGAFPFDLLPDAALARTVVNVAAPIADGETGIVLCDSGLTFDDDAVNSALLVGDNLPTAENPNGSLLGWLAASTNDVVGLLDGVRSTALGFIPDTFPKAHGASIAHILLERSDPKLRIVSTSFERCLMQPDALRDLAAWDLAKSAQEPNRRNGRIRVVNLSAADQVDAAACEARFASGLDDHFLWIAAAGNSGRRHTSETPLARCPQTLPIRGNLLVVAGVNASNTPWPLSDVGSTYADLAADCTGQQGNCGGTSNSAPRVARTAALISQRHGDAISNEMVRMAILLGVTVPSRVLPYRSGGYLNHEDAMAVAAALVAQGFGQNKALQRNDAEKALDGLSWNATYKLQKLDILAENGAFVR